MVLIGEKTKDFVRRHRTKLITSGVLIAVGVICRLAYVYHRRACTDWGIRGFVMGFHGAIDWFDDEFSELNLRELYNDWAQAHPEEIVYV